AIAVFYNYGPGDGIVGLREIEMKKQSGSDSYNSTVGPYGGANVHNNGNIASNGPIRIHDVATIRGNVTYGRNKDKDIDSRVTITGTVGAQSRPLSFKPVTPGDAASNNSNGAVGSGNLKSDG